jgi:thymidylate synthase ThyX
VDSTPDGEKAVLRAIAFTCGGNAGAGSAERLWRDVFRGMGAHDGAVREFEVASLIFEAEISASCFAQLKRHRMMTLLAQPYRVDGGVIIPPSLLEAGMEKQFAEGIRLSHEAAIKLVQASPLLAPYFLTNAQKRCVRIQMNAREFYHFARLRADSHAQWEIRSLAEQMLEQARRLWPNLMLLACGKDQFESVYRAVFND